MKKVKKLLDAIDAWCEADSDVAENGWTNDNEGLWDDAKDLVVSLAEEVRAELEKEKKQKRLGRVKRKSCQLKKTNHSRE